MIDDGDRQHIGISVAWLSDVFDDLRHVQSNTTRALRIFESSGLTYAEFSECVRAAYSQTLRRVPKLRKPMAFWFACLGDQCQRRTHGLTAVQASALYRGQTGIGAKSKAGS